MKFSKNFYLFFSLPVLLLLLLITGYFVLNNKVEYASSTLGDNLAGHSWDTYYGWGSYNNCNEAYALPTYASDAQDCLLASNYGWNITFTTDVDGIITGGELDGYMWHDNLGWICIGATCSSGLALANCGADISPPLGPLNVTFTGSGDGAGWAELSGWAKICEWGDVGEAAWISFNCSNTSACGSSDYSTYVNINNYVLGAPISVEPSNRGFAWNGYTTGSDSNLGVGFIQFDPDNSVSHVIHFRAEDSNIYASQIINARVGLNSGLTGDYNSMYLILGNGSITNVTSEEMNKSLSVTENYNRTDIDFGGILAEDVPGTEEFFYNQIGFLDVGGIEDGDYATIQPVLSEEIGPGPNIAPAGGLVWLRDGNIRITGPITANIGDATDSGDGTVLIKGNLYVSSTIMYEIGIINNIDYLPALTFIVLGDVFIDPSVDQIDGNLFILGNGANCPSDLNAPSAGCGRFSTGSSASIPFVLNGMVMAKQFNLERNYTDPLNTPSELFKFDGRVIANPPPGFDDFATDLPNYEENIPF